MKRIYEPLPMIMNGRYAVLFGKLSEKEKEDTLARMATLIEEERGYEDKGNYGHFCNILPTIAIDEALRRNGEYRLIPETWPETLEKDWLLPWEGNHILIELPIHKASRIGDIVPEDEIKRLLDMGYLPVLAHPERYLYLDMERYLSFKEAGALFQRNIGSLEGLYGEAVSVRAEALLSEGMYDLLGTDLRNERYAAFFRFLRLQG